MALDRAALADSLKLRGALRALTPETLNRISEFWGFTLPSEDDQAGQEQADFLYPRLQTAQYFLPALERLSPPEKEVLYFLAIHGGEMRLAELSVRNFRGNEIACRQLLDGLGDKGFVFLTDTPPPELGVQGTWVSVPEAYLKLLELPPHRHGFLGGLLRAIDSEQLSAIAARVLGEEAVGRLQPSVIRHRIRMTLINPETLKGYIETLGDLEREMLRDLMDRKGFSLYRDMLDATTAKKFDHSRAEQLNSLIGTSGLVFTVAEGHNKYMNSLMVPRDILYIINRKFAADNRSLQKIDSLATGDAVDFQPATVLDNSQALLRDMAIFSGRVDIQKSKRLAAGGISKTDLKKAVAVFPPIKPGKYGAMLATFLIEHNLLVEVNEEWRASELFLETVKDADRCYQDLLRWWLRTSAWSEFFADGMVLGAEKPPQDPVNVLELRRAVLKAISASARDRWISFKAFWETTSPALEAQLIKGAGGTGSPALLNALREATSSMISETLMWLGVVYLGASGEGASSGARARRNGAAKGSKGEVPFSAGAFSFQLTPLGRNLLASGITEMARDNSQVGRPNAGYLAHSARWLIIQPNLEIVAPPDLALDAMFNLARICEIKNVDVMTTFELSRDSMRSALERGTPGEEIIRFFSELSRAELPDTVRQMVSECSTKHGEVRLGSGGGYLVTDDPVVVQSIRRNPKLTGLIKDAVSDTVLILADNCDVTKIAKELRHQGMMPRVETGTVHAATDGRYHLTLTAQEMHDLIAAARLVHFVEGALDADISDGSAAVLAQRLKPEATGFYAADQGAETRAKTYQKRFEAALAKKTEGISEKYKTQVSRLVSKSLTSRGPSKYQYKGTNPAVDRADIAELISFANDYDLDVELLYVKQNDQETRVVVSPKGIEGERIYAHNSATDSDGIYSMARILKARLL